jgi:hypothetical protein
MKMALSGIWVFTNDTLAESDIIVQRRKGLSGHVETSCIIRASTLPPPHCRLNILPYAF